MAGANHISTPIAPNSRSRLGASSGLPKRAMRSRASSHACAAWVRAAARRVSRATSSARARTLSASQSSSTRPTRSAVAGSIERAARQQLRGVTADQPLERAVNHASRKQTHLHFVEPECGSRPAP